MDRAERVEVTSREELDAWLAANHGRPDGVWLVTWRKGGGRPHVPYDAVVEEALRFGWIDSLPRRLDDERTMLFLSPRRPGSNWSALNRRRAEALIGAGRMEPAGLARVEAARADGTWTALDAVEALVVPDDLAAALDAVPGARGHFEAFSRSSRRGILEWIAAARTPGTRARRVAETARLAGENVKANHPEGRNRGVDPAKRVR